MTDERRAQAIPAMKRSQLAALHADEISAALFPQPGADDDAISADEKAVICADVRTLVAKHRREINAWMSTNI